MSLGSLYPWIAFPLNFFIVGIFAFALIRFGLLAVTVAISFMEFFFRFLLTSDFSAWYGTSSILVLVICLALAAYGFHTALGGRPIFAGGLLEVD